MLVKAVSIPHLYIFLNIIPIPNNVLGIVKSLYEGNKNDITQVDGI